MSLFGPTGIFGTSLFGGEPIPFIYLDVDAEVTTRGRRMMARGLTDGTAMQLTEFGVGGGGFDCNDYRAATPVNPDAYYLDNPILLNETIDYYEQANSNCRVFYCLLEAGQATSTLGEIGIWAEIVYSPIAAEVGTTFLFAIGHFPLVAKNTDIQYVFRVSVQA
jgi:hypothetical protein